MKLLVLMAIAAAAGAQTNDAATQQSLVREVRSLRESVERGAALQTRAQIALQRLVLQHQRVERLMGELLDVRRQMDIATADREKAISMIRALEGRIAENPGAPGPRVVWEDTIARTKPNVERANSEMQGCLARHTELSNSLRSEEAKLAALAGQVEEIERLLPLPTLGPRR